MALLLVGFAWPTPLLPPPVVSYTTVSPSPEEFYPLWQFTSLLHLPSSYPARQLAGTVLYEVRTFLSFGEPKPRSPGQLATYIVPGNRL